MQSFVLIDQEQLNNLLESIKDLKQVVLCQSKTKETKSELLDAEIANYVLLKQAWKMLGITKGQWYDKYQYLISYRPYSGMTWVSKESILSFLKDNVIKNKY